LLQNGTGVLSGGGAFVELYRWEVDLIFALMCRPSLTRDEVAEIIWPDPDKMPECWYGGVAQRLLKLREVCEVFGFTLTPSNSIYGLSLYFVDE
jgi:hypothetical protein